MGLPKQTAQMIQEEIDAITQLNYQSNKNHLEQNDIESIVMQLTALINMFDGIPQLSFVDKALKARVIGEQMRMLALLNTMVESPCNLKTMASSLSIHNFLIKAQALASGRENF